MLCNSLGCKFYAYYNNVNAHRQRLASTHYHIEKLIHSGLTSWTGSICIFTQKITTNHILLDDKMFQTISFDLKQISINRLLFQHYYFRIVVQNSKRNSIQTTKIVCFNTMYWMNWIFNGSKTLNMSILTHQCLFWSKCSLLTRFEI